MNTSLPSPVEDKYLKFASYLVDKLQIFFLPIFQDIANRLLYIIEILLSKNKEQMDATKSLQVQVAELTRVVDQMNKASDRSTIGSTTPCPHPFSSIPLSPTLSEASVAPVVDEYGFTPAQAALYYPCFTETVLRSGGVAFWVVNIETGNKCKFESAGIFETQRKLVPKIKDADLGAITKNWINKKRTPYKGKFIFIQKDPTPGVVAVKTLVELTA